MVSNVYGFLRRKSTDPITGINTAAIQDYVASWDAYFCDYARWSFRRTSKVLSIPGRTSLTLPLATTDPTITVASNANASASGGRLAINQDEIDYSGISGQTGITVSVTAGAKGIDLAHLSGEPVDFLVPVPADFGKPGELWVGDSSNPARMKLQYQDTREMPWPLSGNYFENDGYLYFAKSLTFTRAQLVYYKKALKPGQGDDLQTPEKLDRFVLYATVAQCYQVIGNSEKAQEFFLQAGVPTPANPNPTGLLQMYAAKDAEQTDSLDDYFIPA